MNVANYLSASDIVFAVQDLDQFLRAEAKYNDKLSEEEVDAYDKVRDKLREVLTDRNIALENIL